MENEIMSLMTWWSISVKADIPYSLDQCFRTEIFAKQRKRKIVHTFLWWCRTSRGGSSHILFRQSAQCLRSSSGYVRRAGLENLWMFRVQGDLLLKTIRRPWWCQQNCRQRTNHFGPMTTCKETCCKMTSKSSQIPRSSSTVMQAGLFQDSDFAGDLKDSKTTSGGTYCAYLEVTRLFR